MKASDLYSKLIEKGLLKGESDPDNHVLNLILLEEVIGELEEDA